MKKVVRVVILAFAFFFLFVANTNALTEQEMIDQVVSAENGIKTNISILKSWSNSYKSSIKSLISRNVLSQITDLDFSTNINIIINALNSSGEQAAANSLSASKATLLGNAEYAKAVLEQLQSYLEENSSDGVVGSFDLFSEIRRFAKEVKPSINEILDTYYEEVYNTINSKIDAYTDPHDVMDVYNEALNKFADSDALINKIEDKVKAWERIYEDYQLESYNINQYFNEYYNKTLNVYRKLYNKAETKLQSMLDSKIDVIVQNTNLSDYYSVLNRNNKLYDIINYIVQVKDDTNTKFDRVNSVITINKVLTKVRQEEQNVLNRLDKAINYVRSYLIDFATLKLVNEEDAATITIDKVKGIIIVNETNLNADSFVNRLTATPADVALSKAYGANIGTLSKIEVKYDSIVIEDYTVVVKGDTAPNGKFDITDVVKLCNKIFGKENLDELLTIAADLDDSGKIDITDVVKLCNILFK